MNDGPPQIRAVPPMKHYTMEITLVDSGLPYTDKEDAEKAANEWAKELASGENCMVGKVVVREDA